jgi:hypothetical protein
MCLFSVLNFAEANGYLPGIIPNILQVILARGKDGCRFKVVLKDYFL